MSLATRGVLAVLKAALNERPAMAGLGAQAFRFETDTAPGEVDTLSWLGHIPAFRERGTKGQGADLVPQKLDIRVRHFQNQWRLEAPIVRNSKVGPILTQKAGEWTRRRSDLMDSLIANLINNGTTLLAYDGLSFFNSAHVINNSGSVNNTVSFTCADSANPTALEIAKAIAKGVKQFWGFVDDQGLPLYPNMTEIDVVVPVGISDVTLIALTNDNLDTGAGTAQNPLSGLKSMNLKLNLKTSPLITLSKKITLVNRSPGAMPWLLGENPAENRVTELDETSDFFKREDKYEYNAFWAGAASVGEYTDAVQVTLAP
jgi:hypothetical protein